MRSRSGFTLIELLVTVAIIGILAAIATVNFQNYIKTARFTETKSLIGQLAVAIESIKIDEQRYPASYNLYALARKLTETAKNPISIPSKHIRLLEDGDDPYEDPFTGAAFPVQSVLTTALGSAYNGAVVVRLDDADKKTTDRTGPVIVDSWGVPIFYISSDTYCPGNQCNLKSDWSNDRVAAYQMTYDNNKFPKDRVKPFNPTTFQLISFGENKNTNTWSPSAASGDCGIGCLIWDDDLDNNSDSKKDKGDPQEDDLGNF